MEPEPIAGALAALEVEGFAMRGRFTPVARDASPREAPQDREQVDEWCERRLLARIHHYTVRRLRAEIEPVAARDFLRFLLSWQRVAPETRMEGPDAFEQVLAQLEGFEAPAAAWESEILPARLAGYDPAWLDDLCLAGRVTWMRLRPGRDDGQALSSERRELALLSVLCSGLFSQKLSRCPPKRPRRGPPISGTLARMEPTRR